MARNYKLEANLDYLKNKPIRINYTVIAGPRPQDCQMSDLIFSEVDLKIRGLDTVENIKRFREAQND